MLVYKKQAELLKQEKTSLTIAFEVRTNNLKNKYKKCDF